MKISAADILKNLVNPDGTPIMPPGSLVYLSTDDPKGTYLFDTVLILPHSASFFFILRHILSYCIISCLTLFYVFISHLFSFYSILLYLNSSLFCITFPLFFSSLIFSNLSHTISSYLTILQASVSTVTQRGKTVENTHIPNRLDVSMT